MRRWLLINPNVSAPMTERIRAAAFAAAPADVEIVAVTAGFGFPVIATRLSYALAAHAAVEAFAAAEGRFDAILLGCFGDPGLEALRELTATPVIGFAEASFRLAAARRERFAVVTIGPAWEAMLRERLHAACPDADCAGIFALDGTGLDALRDAEAVLFGLERLVRQAAAAGARTILLGGATLSGWAPRLPAGFRYIDCITTAVAAANEGGAPARGGVVLQPALSAGLSTPLLRRLGG